MCEDLRKIDDVVKMVQILNSGTLYSRKISANLMGIYNNCEAVICITTEKEHIHIEIYVGKDR